MLSNAYNCVCPANGMERAHLESLIREDFDRCHPGETLDDVKRRASFSKEDKGLLCDWMALAAIRAATDRANGPTALAAWPARVTRSPSCCGPHAEVFRPEHQIGERIFVED
jgi:hypothetical protein